MATFTKQKLSGSTDGKAIKLTGNDSAGAVDGAYCCCWNNGWHV
jgi:hypothetical protein